MSAAMNMSLKDVRNVLSIIQPLVHRTPVVLSETLSSLASTPDLRIRFFFKCENMQKSGSFKFRGASSFIAQQSDESLRRGLVATSTGNFGQAVALAAKNASVSRALPIDAFVVLPSTSAPSKIAGAKRDGATVVLAGTNPEDREGVARQICQDTGATIVGPMDHPQIVLGQATATLEMMGQVTKGSGETLDAIVLPSATGGLLAGAGIVCADTKTLVFGCEPREGGPDLMTSILSGVLQNPKNQNSVADGLRASTARGNYELIRQKNLVAGLYSISEREIEDSWHLLVDHFRLPVEPSSAVAIGTVLFNQDFRKMLADRRSHWNIGIILTGGNTTIARTVDGLENAASPTEPQHARLLDSESPRISGLGLIGTPRVACMSPRSLSTR